MLFAGWEVRMVKNCDRGLENAARGRRPWPRAVFSSPSSQFFTIRGIEWSLRALASMRAVRLFLRARAVINYVLRVASTLKKYRWRAASTSRGMEWPH